MAVLLCFLLRKEVIYGWFLFAIEERLYIQILFPFFWEYHNELITN